MICSRDRVKRAAKALLTLYIISVWAAAMYVRAAAVPARSDADDELGNITVTPETELTSAVYNDCVFIKTEHVGDWTDDLIEADIRSIPGVGTVRRDDVTAARVSETPVDGRMWTVFLKEASERGREELYGVLERKEYVSELALHTKMFFCVDNDVVEVDPTQMILFTKYDEAYVGDPSVYPQYEEKMGLVSGGDLNAFENYLTGSEYVAEYGLLNPPGIPFRIYYIRTQAPCFDNLQPLITELYATGCVWIAGLDLGPRYADPVEPPHVGYASTASASGGYYYYGDTDLDGKVTAGDARKILRISSALDSYGSFLEMTLADVDGSGVITAADARLALRISAGLVSKNVYYYELPSNGLIVSSSINLSSGGGRLLVTASTVGSSDVKKCGFKYIKLQRLVNGVWTDYTSAVFNDVYSNSASSTWSRSFSVPAGYKWRAVCEHYAESTGIIFSQKSNLYAVSSTVSS